MAQHDETGDAAVRPWTRNFAAVLPKSAAGGQPSRCRRASQGREHDTL